MPRKMMGSTKMMGTTGMMGSKSVGSSMMAGNGPSWKPPKTTGNYGKAVSAAAIAKNANAKKPAIPPSPSEARLPGRRK